MKKLALYILSLGFLSSCEKMSNYDTPNLEELSAKQKAQAEAFTGQFVTYSQLRTRVTTSFSQYEGNDAFEGYVISSDESGNFYKKIYVQAPDKSGTLVVAIDQKGLYGDLPVGSKVQVRLQGTTLWYNSRYSIIEIGYGHGATSSGNPRIHSLPSSMYAQVVVPTTERVAPPRDRVGVPDVLKVLSQPALLLRLGGLGTTHGHTIDDVGAPAHMVSPSAWPACVHRESGRLRGTRASPSAGGGEVGVSP